MRKLFTLTLEPEVALDDTALRHFVLQQASLPATTEDVHIQKLRQSIDARNRQVKVNLDLELYIGEKPAPVMEFQKNYADVSNHRQAIVIGAGPAGLFAALRLIELGIKPIVLERGKDVQARRRDLSAINKEHIVNPDSNYCFGEGGAGTYSDGKLYTRSKKRGDVRRILEILVAHGSTPQILVDTHPHIGTNKLPNVVADLRNSILAAGGEIHFNTKVTDLKIVNDQIKGVSVADGREYQGIAVILATGHSARDIFELLYRKNILIEAKPYAMGVRIEHPQSLIDQHQYHRPERGILPAAAYSLVAQTYYNNVQRGVFSFCMCPGGFIVPSATDEGELVVNGMSPNRRDSKYANSGIVVAINEADWQKNKNLGPLAGLELQKEVEQRAFDFALKSKSFALMNEENKSDTENRHCQLAPAQRLSDFLNGKISASLNATSYQPGLTSLDMVEVLPDFIARPLQDGFRQFGKMIKGYVTNEAQLIGIESRTSSPVRIPRDKESLEHLQIKGLFPCGEGAGFAGGIVSAAMDGERCAEQLARLYGN
ncbi:NAD(P)/FAD-dependent oxidoreductase [Emticicia sp. 21SJ11W-3]|uniref:NAD(P)/FAD-dependent oxidoreductase n=1 Tax=Emticicia sp. 21SJ11W-3 TaxID=2916755 RepID=UPI0020A0A956|nr:FAD-dependent oxidoreductase [Emticicia sp. 21SJ11W-3]UTA69611.1 FAD-binding protein [Emticicia sp. 21SJ11W-3]